MKAHELARWRRFAAKGGIGKCTAVYDCVAHSSDDLMFLKDDEIIVLMQLQEQQPDAYLGYCEGVVGRFTGSFVKFHGTLKRPVLTKRAPGHRTPSPSHSLPTSNSPRPSPSPVTEPGSNEEGPQSVSLNSSPLIDTPRPETTPPPTPSDTESHDFDDEPRTQPSLVSYSSSSSAFESEPATPADFDLNHTQDVELQSHSTDSPTFLENPGFDDTKELETSFVTSEQSTRLSVATIDGAEGIGLSLLQNFMGSSGDEDSDASSDTDMAGYTRRRSLESTVDDHSLNYGTSPPPPTDGRQPALQPASTSASPTSRNARVSRVSSHPSEYSDPVGEEWEGASDIYDNYRYSRFSVASKMSRFSKGSMKAPPPIPPPTQHPSFEQDVVARRLAPLDLEARPPLLQTASGSPLNSPGERTAKSSASAPLSTAGVATAIRTRLEGERNPEAPAITNAHLIPAREGEIVIPDDEQGPEVVPADGSSRPPSPADAGNETFDSTTSSHGIGDDSIVTDETVLAVPSLPETKPLRLPRSPTSPAPQGVHPTPPQSPAIAHPRPSKPSAFDFGSSRTSMFLPHPGAPKAPGTVPVGPLYGRVQSPPSSARLKHSQNSLAQLLHIVATTLSYPNGAPRVMTVYGICETDLANSIGPVPITFTLEPPISVPANRIIPNRSQSSDSNPISLSSSQPSTPTKQSSPLKPTGKGTNSGSIPRANFFPQKPQVRPRSRSFSGFDSMTSKVAQRPGTSGDDALNQRSPQGTKLQPKAEPEPLRPISSRRPNTMNRPVHRPSPLSLPQNSISGDASVKPSIDKPRTPLSATSMSLPSPVSSRSFNSSPLATSPGLSVPMVLRQAVSSIQLRTPSTNSALTPLPKAPPSPISHQTNGGDGNGEGTSSRPAEMATPQKQFDEPRPSISSSECSSSQCTTETTTPKSPNERASSDANSPRESDTRSTAAVSPPLQSTSLPPGALRRISTRSKLSKTTIVTKTSGSDTFGEIQPPTSPTVGTETVQVERMDFELVKPSFLRTSPRSSLDSFPSQEHDNDHQPSPIRQDSTNFLRPESPLSPMSSVVSEKDVNRRASPSSIAHSDVLSPTDINAHRNRELKWVSLMSTLDPTQARKSKKVKKLLLNGVPASVRYQVWAHLADCRGKRMNGLYPQLVQRGAVPATPEIIRDSADRFGDQPQGKDGSIVSVLQAYLTMVPDIQYDAALTCIVGQLLAQSPEEDAFWIFISMMDSYLRPYFSSSIAQVDFDATLFARALGANDPPLAKRIFVEMSILPSTICRQWFCSLFYDAVPAEYHLRVWDVFLFEGIPFLFRVGLALFSCCRRPLLEARNRDRALSILSQVPAQCLPPNGDALIELAMSKKLKDDDIRKARSKAETQKKRNTSTRLLKSSVNPGLPISLPRG